MHSQAQGRLLPLHGGLQAAYHSRKDVFASEGSMNSQIRRMCGAKKVECRFGSGCIFAHFLCSPLKKKNDDDARDIWDVARPYKDENKG